MIRDTIRTAYIYLGILALDAFVYMQALNPSGGPANSTVVISQHLLNTAFKKGKFGYATSMGATLAIITLVFAALVFLVFYLTENRPRKARPAPAVAAGPAPVRAAVAVAAAARPKAAAAAAVPQVTRPAPRPTIWTDKTVAIISHTALIAWVVIICAPLLWVLMSSFKTTKQIFGSPFSLPTSFNFDNYVSAWTTAQHRHLFLQHGDRGRRRAGHRHAAGRDVRLRAGALRVQGQQDHLLPDAGRPDLPDLPRRGAAVPDAAGASACSTPSRA